MHIEGDTRRKNSINARTLRKLQTKVWDGVPGINLLRAEKAVLVVLEALAIGIRPREQEDGNES